MQVKLTPRLKKIAEMVPKSSIVADIGTDHGYISIYLVKNKICPMVIASDVNKKPLQSAMENIKFNGLEDKIITRLGSGLEVLKPNEVDTIIIAGMGGLLIAELLDRCPDVTKTVNTFILQPMQAQEQLRAYLVDKGYKIEEDNLVKEDHKIYEVLRVTRGHQVVEDEIFFEIGFQIYQNPLPLAKEFLLVKLRILEDIIQQVKNRDSEEVIVKYKATMEKFNKIQEVLLCLRGLKK
ncbi:tRNA (adenine(22)-N(1))-methyltransferase [Alkaliphilus serpentinus]|uniref:SAM-dependent methyltransferase n=1 Tax=Alkaliphilus serpentinus TaxID=1482731 RepID=A0A833MFC6_9FIRM|nr:class I SAM-dependent methyltransferase [Alkaliphilus serpentinus]KAB3533233.1 SAM-dependent methyltransferase [Alkaliphilus serpentinus]